MENLTLQKPLFFDTPRWPVLYEDNHLIALYKPAGLLVQGDITGDPNLLDLCRSWLKQRYNKPGRVFLGLVHRLDRPVAGAVLFCKTSKAASRISAQFREKSVKKTYVAVVEGKIEQGAGRLANHLQKRGRSSLVVARPQENSRKATLDFKVLDRMKGRTLLEISLETGRRHQIRAQLAAIGFPIVGDTRYGASSALPGRKIALIAKELEVSHPTLGDRVVFTSPWPDGWLWPGLCHENNPPPWEWKDLKGSVPI